MSPKTEQSFTIRIVFDGAPFAGKTTAAYSLGEALGEAAETPSEEGGRTAWFDWVTYTGGRHEGKAIRVELVTVPGQSHLNERRRHLLEWGDVIVFVADSTEVAFPASVEKFGDLRSDLEEIGDKPIIVVANKRDLDDVVELDDIREQLDLREDESLIESIATAGTGVRQAFIFAVRAALATGDKRFEESSAEELLEAMTATLGELEAQPDIETAEIDAEAEEDVDAVPLATAASVAAVTGLAPTQINTAEESTTEESTADEIAADEIASEEADTEQTESEEVTNSQADRSSSDPSTLSFSHWEKVATEPASVVIDRIVPPLLNPAALDDAGEVTLTSTEWRLLAALVNGSETLTAEGSPERAATAQRLIDQSLIIGRKTEITLPSAETSITPALETDTVESEPVESDAVEPEAVESDAVEPEAVESASVEPEAVESASVEPEAVESASVEPEAPTSLFGAGDPPKKASFFGNAAETEPAEQITQAETEEEIAHAEPAEPAVQAEAAPVAPAVVPRADTLPTRPRISDRVEAEEIAAAAPTGPSPFDLVAAPSPVTKTEAEEVLDKAVIEASADDGVDDGKKSWTPGKNSRYQALKELRRTLRS